MMQQSEVSAGTSDVVDAHQLPAKRDRIGFALRGRKRKAIRPPRWVKRARIGSYPVPTPSQPPQQKSTPVNRATTIEELIPSDDRTLFTSLNAYRYIKHSRDSITRRLISQEKVSSMLPLSLDPANGRMSVSKSTITIRRTITEKTSI